MDGFTGVQGMQSAKSMIENYENTKLGFAPKGGTQAGQGQQSSRDKFSFTFEKEEFIGTQETSITTTIALGQKISNYLGKVFSDLAGAIIVPDQHGLPELVLYFRDVPAREGRKKGIILLKDKLNEGANNNYSAGAQQLMTMSTLYKTNRVYDLTEDARDGLTRFMFKDGNNNINWNQRITEQYANGVNGEILVKLRGLNLVEFAKAIFGYKYQTELNGEKIMNYYDYAINLISPISTPYTMNVYNNGSSLTDYAISIARIDKTELDKVAKIFGQPTTYGTTPMCAPQD